MATALIQKIDYLHDSKVYEISLLINESGDRQLRIDLRCDSECGYDPWNDKNLCLTFVDPIIVYCELFGHMANRETFSGWSLEVSPKLLAGIKVHTDAGLNSPKHTVSLSFHSGSIIEVACQDITIDARNNTGSPTN